MEPTFSVQFLDLLTAGMWHVVSKLSADVESQHPSKAASESTISAYPPPPEWEAAQVIPKAPRVPMSIPDVAALFKVNERSDVFRSFEDLGL